MTAVAPMEKPAGKALVVIGFVVSTFLTGAVTLGVGLYNNAYQTTRTERSAQVDKFVQAAQDFDPLVRQFVADEAKGQLTESTRAAIRGNLLKQHNALQSVRSVAPRSAFSDIDKYDSMIVHADTAIKNAHTISESRDFAQAALDLGVDRENLLRELRAPPSLTLN